MHDDPHGPEMDAAIVEWLVKGAVLLVFAALVCAVLWAMAMKAGVL